MKENAYTGSGTSTFLNPKICWINSSFELESASNKSELIVSRFFSRNSLEL